ncbi:sensor histidine kinase [Buchananella felis]|uniref:sensor histidine kinase n=1 Tax=Buchananella felis TaxID=3231492 RepID=UPI003528AFA3
MPESRPQSFWFSLSAATVFVVAALASLTGVAPYSPGAMWVLGACVVGLASLAAWFAWQAVRVRRQAAREVSSAQERAAVLRERLLIASELHDVLSHGLGAITLRARAGAIGVMGDVAADALNEIAALSSAATSELRRLLLVLRDPEAASPLRPAVGIAAVGELAAQMRGAGLAVEVLGLEVRAEAGAELLVYQVVREALKNTLKHAGPTTVRCRIESAGGQVHVVVADEGPRGYGRAGSSGDSAGVGEGGAGGGGAGVGHRAGGVRGAGDGGSVDHRAEGVRMADGMRMADGVRGAGSGHGLGLLAQLVAAAGGELKCGPRGRGFMVEAVIPGGGARG